MQKGILFIFCFILSIQTQATDTCKAMIQANFSAPNVCVGSEAQYTNTSASDPNQSNYSWSFGDGNFSSQRQPRHAYDSANFYIVWLKVELKNGCIDSIFKIVNIKPLPTTCNFDIIPDTSTSVTSYKFLPTGGPLTGLSYTWLTGDGNTITTSANAANYTYSKTGKYCVTMIATTDSGCKCSMTKCLTLSSDLATSLSFDNRISISPVPSNGVFTIKLDANINSSKLVEIYNSIGVLVKTLTFEGNNADIDLSTYTNGVYMARVIADHRVATKQIILNN